MGLIERRDQIAAVGSACGAINAKIFPIPSPLSPGPTFRCTESLDRRNRLSPVAVENRFDEVNGLEALREADDSS